MKGKSWKLDRYEETSLKLANLSTRLILGWITWIHQSSPHFPHPLVDTLKLYTIGSFSHFSPITKLGSMGSIWIGERIYIQPWEKYFQRIHTHTHTLTYCEQNFKLSQEEIINLNMEIFCQRVPKFQFTCMTTFHHIFNTPHVIKILVEN